MGVVLIERQAWKNNQQFDFRIGGVGGEGREKGFGGGNGVWRKINRLLD
jgi:hypothetical protein